MNRIAVLLAVYNGMKWIDEQILSILEQEKVDVVIYISVDLSTDGSYEYILNKYGSYPEIKILPYGLKFGSAGKNFYHLIENVDVNDYDFSCFADQDDIWLKDKLKNAISKMTSTLSDGYSSNVTAFWDDGRTCLIDKSQPQVEYDYLFESAGPGCTYLFNKVLAVNFRAFILANPVAKNVELHDWLIYAFARSNDYKWIIDEQPFMLYRQHSNNQFGANSNFTSAFKRLSMGKDGWYKSEVTKICSLFVKNKNILNTICGNSFKHKIFLIKNISKIRRKNSQRLAMILFILLGYV